MRNKLIALFATVGVMTSGCGVIFTSSHQVVTFDSDPRGAEVILDGMPIGRTPMQVSVDNRRSHMVAFEMEGAYPAMCQLQASVGALWVVLDVLFTGLVGIIIDAATNGWTTLQANACYVRMQYVDSGAGGEDLVQLD